MCSVIICLGRLGSHFRNLVRHLLHLYIITEEFIGFLTWFLVRRKSMLCERVVEGPERVRQLVANNLYSSSNVGRMVMLTDVKNMHAL
jgi:hypothetical protein